VLQERAQNFSWKLLVVYDPAYEDKKVGFIDELHSIVTSWQGPMPIGGDFNLCRYAADKSNGRINKKFANCFNNWINRCALIEFNLVNRKFTWSNNQAIPILAKLDRVFASPNWEMAYPLVRVTALPREISDHSPLLDDTSGNQRFGKKKFRFEKWWLERADFKEVVVKAWSTAYASNDPMEVCQSKIRALRRQVRGCVNNVVAELNKHK
jgi:hypothetical protein